MTNNKQYPPLPDFEEVEQHIYGASRRYIPQDMLEPIHDLMRAYADADRAVRHDELEQLCAEAYQVVGVLLDDTGQFNTEHACKILDNLSQMRRVHDDVLPWESVDMDAMRAAQAAPQPVEHPWVASDTVRADLIADLHDVFDTSGSETPQIVHDVIEYANSWLQVHIQKKAESPTQPAAPASHERDKAIDILVQFAEGLTTHNYSGACPSNESQKSRDPQCMVCWAIDAAIASAAQPSDAWDGEEAPDGGCVAKQCSDTIREGREKG